MRDRNTAGTVFRLKEEVARLEKIVAALIDRAESINDPLSRDFGVFQMTVLLEDQVRSRTQELNAATQQVEASNRLLRESRAQLRLLLDSTAEGIFGIDMDGNCTFSNRSCLKLLGYTHFDELIGKNMHNLIHSRHADGSHFPVEDCRVFRSFQNTVNSHVDDEVLWRADGTSFAAEYWSYPQKVGDKTVGAVVSFLDISARKLNETLLDYERTQLRTLLETLPELVWLKNPEGVYLTCNPAFERFFGASEADIVGKTDYDFVPTAQADFFRLNDRKAVAANGPRIYEQWVTYVSDGRQVLLETTKTPMRDFEGNLTGVLGIAHDITKRKQDESELLRSNSELEQFSYSISHDMRQPLRMISSYLTLLEMELADQLNGEKREYLDFAIGGAKRLDTMMLGLLECSRIGRKGESPSWTESRELLDEALLFLQPAITEASAEVFIEGDWPRILVSPDEMLRLIQNLIGNALKFCIDGRTPEITITSNIMGENWRLCVADNGIGIIPDQIGRLFQVFQRLQSRASFEGTGIGLALCRKIAEHHGGKIWVVSQGQGQGSSFHVQLPIGSRTEVPLEARTNVP